MPASCFRSIPSAGLSLTAMPSIRTLAKVGGVCFSKAVKSKSSTEIFLIAIGSVLPLGVSGGGVTTTPSSTKPLSPSALPLL